LRKRLETAGNPKLPTPPDAVIGVKRGDIRVAKGVFQWRLTVANIARPPIHLPRCFIRVTDADSNLGHYPRELRDAIRLRAHLMLLFY
jgi:hypothetical protein